MSFLDRLEKSTPQEAVTLLSQRFSKNRDFFQKNLPHLLSFIDKDLQEYELNISNSGINILHKETGGFVYPVENGVSTIFSYSKSVAHGPASNRAWSRHINEALISTNELSRVPKTGQATMDITTLAQKDPDFTKTLIQYSGAKQLPTACLFGVLGGLHIEYMLDQFENFHGILIYEPNIDFFVLSTYFVDYEKLYQKSNEHSCYLVVNGKLPTKIVKDFFGTRLITNSYFRLEHNAYEHPFIKDAKLVVDEFAKIGVRGWGTYEDEVVGLKNKLGWLNPKEPKYPFLYKSEKIETPICVVGNGPSLNKSIEFLKNNQNNFIIFSSGTALAPLRRNGIKPDYQIEIERMDHVKEWLEDAGLDDIPLIAADIVHESTLSISKKTFMFVRTATAAEDVYKPKFTLDNANPIVGNAAFALALNFSQNIYVVGMDLGFKDDLKQHAKGSKYDEMKDTSVEKLPTRGNLSNNIFTNSLYSLSKSTLERAILHSDSNVYNLSDGVYVDGAKPTKTENVSLEKIDKKRAKLSIEKCFKKEKFFKSTKNNYSEILEDYKKNIIKILKTATITDKRDLFHAIDLTYYATTIQRRTEPVSGTLMSGTMWHILNTIFVMLLKVDRDDVDALYKELITITQKNLGAFVIE